MDLISLFAATGLLKQSFRMVFWWGLLSVVSNLVSSLLVVRFVKNILRITTKASGLSEQFFLFYLSFFKKQLSKGVLVKKLL